MGSRGCLSRGSLVRAAALILMSLLSSESSPSSPSDRSASVAFPDSPLAIAAAARSALCSSPPCGRRVIVGFSNMGYRKFTLNWVNPCSRNQLHCQALRHARGSDLPTPQSATDPLRLVDCTAGVGCIVAHPTALPPS